VNSLVRANQTHYKRQRQKKAASEFSVPKRWCYSAKIITAVAVAFLLAASCFHLRAVRGPGRDRLGLARHLAAGAARLVLFVAEAAEHRAPCILLVGRALHPRLRHQERTA